MAGSPFQLLNLNDPLPAQYRLATTQDVECNKQALFQAMPAWEIANLANGSVQGALYGGPIRCDIRNDVAHKLAIYDPCTVSQPSHPLTFKLLNLNDPLPAQYRLATTQKLEGNKQALFQAMPEWEIANLANGSVDGAKYGGRVRCDVAHKLAIYDPSTCSEISQPSPQPSQPLTFRLFDIQDQDQLPPQYRLATVQDVQAN